MMTRGVMIELGAKKVAGDDVRKSDDSIRGKRI